MSKRYQNISRYQEIGVILIKHGFGYLAQQIGFKDLVFWRSHLSASYKKPEGNLSLPERIRYLFEDLGPTFIKLGQLLSSRPDLIPEEYIVSLEKLQDMVDTIDAQLIKEQIIKSLRKQPDEIFAYFDNEPLASASIGQVHRAVLVTGEEVVVKVQKPLIKELIHRDLGILEDLTGVLRDKTPLGQVCDVQEIKDIFSRHIKRELDYYIEGANTEGFYNLFRDCPNIKVPKVYWEYTTREVIVLEFIHGNRISEIYDRPIDPRDKEAIAATLLHFIIMPFFRYGLFHGDPHPGNLIYTDDGALGIIDFGIVGRIDTNFRKYMAQLMIAMMRRDVLATIDIIMKTGEVVGKVNQQYLYEDIAELVDQATGAIVGDVSFANIINEMINISLRHGILMPTAFFNIGKSFIVSEGIARRIYPSINILKVAQPIAIEFMQKEMMPDFSPENVFKKLSDTLEAATEIPFDFAKAVKKLADGETKVTFYHRNLNWLYHILKQSTIRICISLIIAALLVGSALVMHTGKGALLWGFPVIGLLGFSLATIMGIMLTIHMFRSLN